MKYLKYPLLFLNIVFVLALFASYMSSYISPEASKIFPLFGLLYPIIFFGNILFIIFWFFYKWTYSLISFAALLIGFSSAQRFLNFASEQVIKSPDIVEVFSYNVASGYKVSSTKRDYFYQFLTEECEGGISFFQESTAKINNELKSIFPSYHFVQIPKKRATIMSKYPIYKSGYLDFHDSFNVCVWADINYNGKKLRIYSVHLQSNGVTSLAEDVRNSGELGDKETWTRVGTMMKKYTQSTIRRNTQVQQILSDIEKLDYPVIVGGDFNDVPQSYLYTQISEKLQDAFLKRGFGMGTSFNGSIPALRIDYIFTDKSFQILNYKTHKVDYSDHFPISSDILIRK